MAYGVFDILIQKYINPKEVKDLAYDSISNCFVEATS
jgi:hypothetical protein